MINYLFSSLRRELQERLAFRWTILFEVISTATMLAIFFLIDRFQTQLFGNRFSAIVAGLNTSYFGYVSLGLAVSALASVGLGGTLSRMRSERAAMALEYLMASPVSIQRWAVASGIANLIHAVSRFAVIFIVAAVIMKLQIPHFNLLAAILLLLVALVPLWCLSTLTLSSSIIFRRGDPLGLFLGTAFELLGGVYVPPEVLPRWIARFGELLPITPAVRAMQNIVYKSADLSAISSDLYQLLALTIVYLPVSLLCVSVADRIARKKGYYCLS